jgi:hypothetical protein
MWSCEENTMTPADALQYLAGVAQDFARTLPPSTQGPFAVAVNEALQTLAPLTNAPTADAMVNGDAEAVERATRAEGRERKPPNAGPRASV